MQSRSNSSLGYRTMTNGRACSMYSNSNDRNNPMIGIMDSEVKAGEMAQDVFVQTES